MKLYVDLETLQLIEGPGFRNPVTSLRFKRGDAVKLEVAFLTGGSTPTIIGNPASLQIQFGVKVKGRYDLGYLVYATEWTMPTGSETNPVYVCSPSFNTLELDAAMHVGEGVGLEQGQIELMGEMTWIDGYAGPTSTGTIGIVVENDVVRGGGLDPTRAAVGAPAIFRSSMEGSPIGPPVASAVVLSGITGPPGMMFVNCGLIELAPDPCGSRRFSNKAVGDLTVPIVQLYDTNQDPTNPRWVVVTYSNSGDEGMRIAEGSSSGPCDPWDAEWVTFVGSASGELVVSIGDGRAGVTADFMGQTCFVGDSLPYDEYVCFGSALTDWVQTVEHPAALPTYPRVMAYKSGADQVLTPSQYTTVIFDTEEYDTHGCFAGSTFTAPHACFLRISGGIYISAGSTGLDEVAVKVNGTAVKRMSRYSIPAGSIVPFGCMIHVNAGDTVNIGYACQSGMPKTVTAASTITFVAFEVLP